MRKKETIHDDNVEYLSAWAANLKKWAKAHETFLTFAGMTILAIMLGWALAGCAAPAEAKSTSKMYIVNSLWQVVKTVEVSAREVIGDDVNEEIEAYNAETLDDFLRVYYDTVPDLANAPLVNVYICNPATYAVNMSAEGISRQDLIDNIVGWRAASFGQILFIDHVPPPPVVIPPPSMYAYYAIYEVDNTTGNIVLEDHCGYNADESFTGQWITDPAQGGWASVDAYYAAILHAYQSDATVTANNVHVVTRQLYTDPTP